MAMNGSGFKFGLSITLVSGQAVEMMLVANLLLCTQPSSYWYLRGFDIVAIDPVVDFLNIMTYDLHGTWDGTDPYIGAVALAHTNLTEIQQSLDLLWRNNINPSKVNLGIGFYGRSTLLLSLYRLQPSGVADMPSLGFTMSNPNCLTAGCPFSSGANPGPCTETSGILSAAEIRDIVATGKANVVTDSVAGVKIITWDGNQWVSYDDEATLKMKVDFGNKFCLGGLVFPLLAPNLRIEERILTAASYQDAHLGS